MKKTSPRPQKPQKVKNRKLKKLKKPSPHPQTHPKREKPKNLKK